MLTLLSQGQVEEDILNKTGDKKLNPDLSEHMIEVQFIIISTNLPP